MVTWRCAAKPRRPSDDTASAILDMAERLVQTRGFNGFSYADVAAELGITKARAALPLRRQGRAGRGADRPATRTGSARRSTTSTPQAPTRPRKLEPTPSLYAEVLAQDRMCLCGMLAAEYQTLPEPMRHAVIGFFDYNETWLAGVIEQGRETGHCRSTGPTGRSHR